MDQNTFVSLNVTIRHHQLSDLYSFLARLARGEEVAFPGKDDGKIEVKEAFDNPNPDRLAEKITSSMDRPQAPLGTKPVEEAPPASKGPPTQVVASPDPSKFSGCRNVGEVVQILMEAGFKTYEDVYAEFMKVRAGGTCQAANVVPEANLDKRIRRAIDTAA